MKTRKGWKHRKIEIDDKLVTVQVNSNGDYGKFCPEAQEFLPPEDFFIRKSKKGGYALSSYSRKANSELTRKHRQDNRVSHLLSAVKHRAKRQGLVFDLEKDSLTLPDVCPILGIELDHEYGPRTEARSTVDRIDNSKGYEKGNVVVCSWRANRLKNDASFEEIEKIYKFVKQHNGD